MSELRVRILGGSWISGANHGLFRSGSLIDLTSNAPALHDLETLCAPLPRRYGRFDLFTKVGFLGIALALRDSAKDVEGACGIIFSTKFEAMATDMEFYNTTKEGGGSFSSANLFPYTLPVVAAGEAASFFKLHGPSFCVGDDGMPGRKALQCALLQLHEDPEMKVLAGWIEVPSPEAPDRKTGAVFALLQAGNFIASAETYDIDLRKQSFSNTASGQKINSLIDFFQVSERCRS